MQVYTRQGDKVLNLRGAWPDAGDHRLMTTTRDFFGEKAFLGLRSNLAAFKSAQPQAYGIIAQAARNGSEISEKDRTVLQTALKGQPLESDWNASSRGVLTAVRWTQQHGNAMPEALLSLEGRPVLPDELAQDVRRFEKFTAAHPEKGQLITAFLTHTRHGEPQDRPTKNALHEAGLLDGADRVTFQGRALATHLFSSSSVR